MGKNKKISYYSHSFKLGVKSRLLSCVIRTFNVLKRLVFSLRPSLCLGFKPFVFSNKPFAFFDDIVYLLKRRIGFGVIINHITEYFSRGILMNNNLAICNMPSFNRAFNNNFIFHTHTFLPERRIYSLKQRSKKEINKLYYNE